LDEAITTSHTFHSDLSFSESEAAVSVSASSTAKRFLILVNTSTAPTPLHHPDERKSGSEHYV
jgi:hypothetical protein